MLSDFFRINLPYGIVKNEQGEWMAFNREYMPIGYNTDQEDRVEDSRLYTKYKGVTEKMLTELAWGEGGIQRDKKGKISRIFLYNDELNPRNQHTEKEALWNDYFKKLKRLSRLNRASVVLN